MTLKQELRFKAELRKQKKVAQGQMDIEVPGSPEYNVELGRCTQIDECLIAFRNAKRRYKKNKSV